MWLKSSFLLRETVEMCVSQVMGFQEFKVLSLKATPPPIKKKKKKLFVHGTIPILFLGPAMLSWKRTISLLSREKRSNVFQPLTLADIAPN